MTCLIRRSHILSRGIAISKQQTQIDQKLFSKRISSKRQSKAACRFFTDTPCINSRSSHKSLAADGHAGNVTVDAGEVERFRRLASDWWKSGGNFDALRSMNTLRVPFIKDALLGNNTPQNRNKPLKGYAVLDVGSGGGILAEPLARLGAQVIGLDPVLENVEASKLHSSQDPSLKNYLVYQCKTIEDHALDSNELYDMVVASEVIEHVDRLDVFLHSCCKLVKPGGHIFISTINRTLPALLFAKLAAEYMLQLVPPETHTYDKFVTPEEVVDALRIGNMVELYFKGMILNPITNHWTWTSSTAMNYICHARKPLL